MYGVKHIIKFGLNLIFKQREVEKVFLIKAMNSQKKQINYVLNIYLSMHSLAR